MYLHKFVCDDNKLLLVVAAEVTAVELFVFELLPLPLPPPIVAVDELLATVEVLLRFNENGRLHSLFKLLGSNSPRCDVFVEFGTVTEDVADGGAAVDDVEFVLPNCNLGCRRIPLLFEEADNMDEDDAVVDIGVNKLS